MLFCLWLDFAGWFDFVLADIGVIAGSVGVDIIWNLCVAVGGTSGHCFAWGGILVVVFLVGVIIYDCWVWGGGFRVFVMCGVCGFALLLGCLV